MISNSTLYCMYLGVTLTFILPMVIMLAGIILNKFRIAPIFLGMFIYMISSYMIRLPMVLGLNSIGVYETIQSSTFLFAIVSSFMIAFSLGIGRVLAWLPSRKNHDLKGAMSLGFGMGALDCIFMLGMDMFTTMTFAKAYNDGNFASLMEGMDASYVAELTTALLETQGYVYVLSSVERVVLMLLEMVVTVILYKFWKEHKTLNGMLTTMGISWFVMATASLLYSMNIWLGAIYLVICGAVGIYFLVRIYKSEPREEENALNDNAEVIEEKAA